MKVLNISMMDQKGNRFNGLALRPHLERLGIQSRHLVTHKQADDDQVSELQRSGAHRRLGRAFRRLESLLSLQALLDPTALFLPLREEFRWADLLHFHILQEHSFNLLALPLLTRLRPAVWTIHDPWAMTGHCNHPFDCTRWKTHCRQCPALRAYPPLRRDTTAWLFRTKKLVYRASRLEIVVASDWMLRMARQSPLLSSFPLHHIPFGVDLDYFAGGDHAGARQRLGIFDDRFVIAMRADAGTFKGLDWIRKALRTLRPTRPVALLTVYERGWLNEFIGQHQVVELGWIDDPAVTLDFFAAADLFLMPSDADSFGMMAVEAMAAGKPVISMEGTAIPGTTCAPEVGLSFPNGDIAAFAALIQRLIEDDAERARRGRAGRRLIESQYDIRMQATLTANLYRQIAATPDRWQAAAK